MKVMKRMTLFYTKSNEHTSQRAEAALFGRHSSRRTCVPLVYLSHKKYVNKELLIMEMKIERQKRKIHVLLPRDLHRKLRVRCAYDDVSIQEYVESLIASDMKQREGSQANELTEQTSSLSHP